MTLFWSSNPLELSYDPCQECCGCALTLWIY